MLEDILIRQKLKESISISQEVLSKIVENSVYQWICLTFDPENTIDINDRIKFYKLAKTTTPHIESIIFKQLAYYMKNQFSRKVRSWVPRSVVIAFKSLNQFYNR